MKRLVLLARGIGRLPMKPDEEHPDGPWFAHYADGTIKYRGTADGGEMHGFWEWFRKDGSIMRTGYFDHGKQVGAWCTYDKIGRLVKETRFSTVTRRTA